jgi:hypothetical protein
MTGRGKDIGNHLRNKLIRGHTRSAVMDSLGLLIRRVVGSTPTGPPACRRHRDHEASQRARSQPARMARIPRISLETKAEAAATSEMTLAMLDQGWLLLDRSATRRTWSLAPPGPLPYRVMPQLPSLTLGSYDGGSPISSTAESF